MISPQNFCSVALHHILRGKISYNNLLSSLSKPRQTAPSRTSNRSQSCENDKWTYFFPFVSLRLRDSCTSSFSQKIASLWSYQLNNSDNLSSPSSNALYHDEIYLSDGTPEAKFQINATVFDPLIHVRLWAYILPLTKLSSLPFPLVASVLPLPHHKRKSS